MIVVVAAGNDGCNVNLFTPTHKAEVFSVGATSSNRFSVGQDAKWPGSRTGAGISGFAPGSLVEALSRFGGSSSSNLGTSFAAPYVAGVFALACQALSTAAVNCNNSLDTSMKYNALRNAAMLGTVVNTDGNAFVDGTVSRFIVQRW